MKKTEALNEFLGARESLIKVADYEYTSDGILFEQWKEAKERYMQATQDFEEAFATPKGSIIG